MNEKYRKISIFALMISIFLLLISISIRNERQKKLVLFQYLSTDEVSYVIDNSIPVDDLLSYVKYDNFNIYYYHSYVRIRDYFDLTPLESINLFHNPNYYFPYKDPKPALFLETPLVLVNKSYYLDKDYVPKDLVNISDYNLLHFDRPQDEIHLKREAMEHLSQLFLAATENGHKLFVYSGYRSYQKQEYLYYEVYQKNDDISARPGFSEHQTGYAVDISTSAAGLSYHFEKTEAYRWLIENAHQYGFILRYPKNKKDITGYEFEPWHFRYLGSYAEGLYLQDLSLEEYILLNYEI